MEDRQHPDVFTVTICRHEDGHITAIFYLQELGGLVLERVERLYAPGTDVSDPVNDACKVACGWGALGALGFGRAMDDIRALQRY